MYFLVVVSLCWFRAARKGLCEPFCFLWTTSLPLTQVGLGFEGCYLLQASFVSRAPRKVPHCQRDCHASERKGRKPANRGGRRNTTERRQERGASTSAFRLTGYESLFFIARPKPGASNPHIGVCGKPVFGVAHDARNAPSEIMKPEKPEPSQLQPTTKEC